ncbi:MAG: hypothetical protein ACFN1I_00985 [Selenomonas artemidis]
MANEKGVILKSVSLERTAQFEAFVAAQKNFSRSIRVLIQEAIFRHDGRIVDIWEEYETALQRSIFEGNMRPVRAVSRETQEEPQAFTHAINETHRADSHRSIPAASRPETPENDIPEGYR